MSNIEKVKKLREATGAGFKDCNTAIKESNGDLDKAVEILRIKGISKASKKMTRDAKEGVVAISGDQNKTSIIDSSLTSLFELSSLLLALESSIFLIVNSLYSEKLIKRYHKLCNFFKHGFKLFTI